jgi:hypothetical protein
MLGIGRIRGVETEEIGETAGGVGLDGLVLVGQEGFGDELLARRVERRRFDGILCERFKLFVQGLDELLGSSLAQRPARAPLVA